MTLSEIKKKVGDRLELRKVKTPFNDLVGNFRPSPLQSIKEVFPQGAINIIAEVKKASPSEGDIAPHADPIVVATEYMNCGAKALSILTEPDFFKGKLEYISKVKKNLPGTYVLMKDFIFDEYQILEGACAGADCILLIVALLDSSKLKGLQDFAKGWGLNTLVEVHSEKEMELALKSEANFIGVNNRNLKTMKIDLEISKNLAQYNSHIDVLISESGLRSGEQLKNLAQVGYRGFLIGTEFMKSPSPGRKLKQVLNEATQ